MKIVEEIKSEYDLNKQQLVAENERLRRELRLLRMDHDTLLSSTDVRSELMALNDKYE
jgi:hypothetical protein